MDIYENDDLKPETADVPEETQEEAATQPQTEPAQFVVNPEPNAEEPWEPEKKKKHPRTLRTVLALVLVAAVSCSLTSLFYLSRLTAQEKRTEQMLSQLRDQVADLQEELDSKSFTGNGNSVSGSDNEGTDGGMTPGQVYAKTVKSVVCITSQARSENAGQITTSVSNGTGFIITGDGYIVTNYHVIEGASVLTVTTYDGDDYTATVAGYDAGNDLAVLKVEAQDLQAVTIGSSDDLIEGDQVVIIGNALGELTATLTVGYVSGVDRVVSTDGSLINMLQTDAAVNPGNSGGPVFNMNGQVVGIVTAKYSGTTSSGASIEGIGFAIPIDDVTKKISDLKDYGYITGAYLGVLVQDMDQDIAQYYGLPMGAYVSEATVGYCANAAGVKAKDIIIALGDYQVTSINDLTRALQNFQGGDVTTITVWRSGIEVVLDITLDAKTG